MRDPVGLLNGRQEQRRRFVVFSARSPHSSRAGELLRGRVGASLQDLQTLVHVRQRSEAALPRLLGGPRHFFQPFEVDIVVPFFCPTTPAQKHQGRRQRGPRKRQRDQVHNFFPFGFPRALSARVHIFGFGWVLLVGA